jgi:hypothetical protein
MKYAVLCMLLWAIHLTINAITEIAYPRQLTADERQNACIDLFAEANTWKTTLCNLNSQK